MLSAELTTLSQSIDQAYAELVAASTKHTLAQDAVLISKQAIKDREIEILVSADPKELGSNEAQRTATLQNNCKAMIELLRERETEAHLTSLAFNRAQYEVDRLKLHVRIYECIAMTAGK